MIHPTLKRLLVAAFGRPNISATERVLRAIRLNVLLALTAALIDIAGQAMFIKEGSHIDFSVPSRVFFGSLIPGVSTYLMGLRSYLQAEARKSSEEVKALVETAIKLPAGSSFEDVLAIHERINDV